MATGTITLYNEAKLKIINNTIDVDTHTLKIILLNNSHVFNAAHTQLSDITANQLPTANGYTRDAKTLTSASLTQSGGVVKFDAADVSWTASGGDITASYAVIYDDTVAGDPIILQLAFSAEESAGTGTDFNIIWDANGIFTVG